MNTKKAANLLDRYLHGKVNKEEEALVQYWLLSEIKKNESEEEDQTYPQNHIEMWDTISKTINTKKINLWPRISVVAAAIAVISMSIWFYSSRPVIVTPDAKIANQTDIAPGGNKATLTLGNGKTIQLSNAKTGLVIGKDLRYNDNTAINSTAQTKENEMASITTPRGGTYQIQLPDGTKVWLNAASSLKFPSTFANVTERKVELKGEAYFEVAKDKKHPFIVKSADQDVKVLGTHFNIDAYEDEASVKTTLLEGSIYVVNSIEKTGKTLIPGQQSIISGHTISINNQVDLEEAVAWKNGYFNFNESLESIMNKVSRWYNVDVIYEVKPASDPFVAKISRAKSLSALLNIIEKTGDVHFKIEGRRVIVTK
ncbi:FecR family protein [Pedobacter hiemivivus]|uniref:FecR family protein n=1 Tax=Pedobacter hiemivivus TaxID=2530454 RepID=A0A4V5PER5_9SPHI|nr:FecR family protein [Pedobacter hiemivivus]TKC62436.1 FecR family protein [Pedobacter hiemivivus]